MARHRLRTWSASAIALGVCVILTLGSVATARADAVVVTNLVTDDQSVDPARLTDSQLVNAWGISASFTGPFWVSNNGTGVSTLYTVDPATDNPAKAGLVVTIPGDGSVTGQVFNTASASGASNGNAFLFVNVDVLQLSDANNVYKGVTLDTVGGNTYLL
jgi:hypothetical protein